MNDALASGLPALINAVIDPTAGTESGHIQNLNPKSERAGRMKELARTAAEPALEKTV